jgi:hypothetical protein
LFKINQAIIVTNIGQEPFSMEDFTKLMISMAKDITKVKPWGIHLIDQYLIMFIHKGVFKL